MIEWIQSQKNKCKHRPYIVVIDGMCASGKTTLGKHLERIFNAALISMDDFFLPFELKSSKRLKQPGGNIHYERFYEEVIKQLPHPFTYRVFNCKTQAYDSYKTVSNLEMIIIEGSYAMHPYFGSYYDDAIFLKITPENQKKRIEIRNPDLKEDFFQKWIPLENYYFQFFKIEQKATKVLEAFDATF